MGLDLSFENINIGLPLYSNKKIVQMPSLMYVFVLLVSHEYIISNFKTLLAIFTVELPTNQESAACFWNVNFALRTIQILVA